MHVLVIPYCFKTMTAYKSIMMRMLPRSVQTGEIILQISVEHLEMNKINLQNLEKTRLTYKGLTDTVMFDFIMLLHSWQVGGNVQCMRMRVDNALLEGLLC